MVHFTIMIQLEMSMEKLHFDLLKCITFHLLKGIKFRLLKGITFHLLKGIKFSFTKTVFRLLLVN